jgi:hypothetical protein
VCPDGFPLEIRRSGRDDGRDTSNFSTDFSDRARRRNENEAEIPVIEIKSKTAENALHSQTNRWHGGDSK